MSVRHVNNKQSRARAAQRCEMEMEMERRGAVGRTGSNVAAEMQMPAAMARGQGKIGPRNTYREGGARRTKRSGTERCEHDGSRAVNGVEGVEVDVDDGMDSEPATTEQSTGLLGNKALRVGSRGDKPCARPATVGIGYDLRFTGQTARERPTVQCRFSPYSLFPSGKERHVGSAFQVCVTPLC